jgi:hypothetical protein
MPRMALGDQALRSARERFLSWKRGQCAVEIDRGVARGQPAQARQFCPFLARDFDRQLSQVFEKLFLVGHSGV